MFVVQYRKKIEVNTDPQRRCYDGCHASSEFVWTDWRIICTYNVKADAEDSMATFRRINPQAEYRMKED